MPTLTDTTLGRDQPAFARGGAEPHLIAQARGRFVARRDGRVERRSPPSGPSPAGIRNHSAAPAALLRWHWHRLRPFPNRTSRRMTASTARRVTSRRRAAGRTAPARPRRGGRNGTLSSSTAETRSRQTPTPNTRFNTPSGTPGTCFGAHPTLRPAMANAGKPAGLYSRAIVAVPRRGPFGRVLQSRGSLASLAYSRWSCQMPLMQRYDRA